MRTEAETPAQQLALLKQAADAVEEILLAGTTTASQSTQRSLAAAFEEVSRARFLRLGSTLRIVLEELKRLQTAPERFSGSRLAFFLDRAWLLARTSRRALETDDQALQARLTAGPANCPVNQMNLALLGVMKRHVPGAFSAFEFRLRLIEALEVDGARLEPGTPMLYSLVFPARAGAEVPPEAFLTLQQKQGFRPTDLLQHKQIVLENAALSTAAPWRIALGPESKLNLAAELDDWSAWVDWSPRAWLQKLKAHRPDPLELAVELNDEVLLRDWRLTTPFEISEQPGRGPEQVATLAACGMHWTLRVDAAESHLLQAIETAQAGAEGGPALFAMAHVELGRAVLTPLSLLDARPAYITISEKQIDKAALVKALNKP
ncbi:hypothetical protein [Pseudomarimonas arenosa]|uniref:Uncharacterized protein n=1 Tax=Pseudomarimonas arenosa TaxID=2774145 RepID=A0AAW3ZSE4_9GAMM|nr:hypothetical protein [Pseudomarimonas arenosa]MBD8528012.1 hypothetical protein [Pseudomarimonas arenosa]